MTANQTARTRKLVQSFYQALATRNLDVLVSLFSETVDWDIPGNEDLAPWLGKRRGRVEIRAFFELLWSSIDPIQAHIDHILVEHEFAIATGTFSSRMLRTGSVYNSMFSAHFTVLDGQIVRYRLQEDSYGLVEALSLPRPEVGIPIFCLG